MAYEELVIRPGVKAEVSFKDMTVKYRQYGFTLVELLTVLAIISMLVGLLMPTITLVRNTAKNAKQRAQLTTIDNALMVWRNDQGKYPESVFEQTYPDYCGAQKLTEALLGWDLLGFHPESDFRAVGKTDDGKTIYDTDIPAFFDKRKPRYLEMGTVNAFRLGTVAEKMGLFEDPGSLAPDTYVLCDVFGVRRIKVGQGKAVKAGSPILYYKANTSSKTMEPTDPSQMPACIYNALDNLFLLGLKKLTPNGETSDDGEHKLADQGGMYFYDENYKIIDQKVLETTTGKYWPHRPDSYILISAGVDGEYGTSDDICNF